MLPKQMRLKKQSAFMATYRIRNSYSIQGIVLWAGTKKSDPKYPTRVGFVVSKKTHKRAVRRNRLKRLMRESYRILVKENKIPNSQEFTSLIFVGFEKALEKDFSQVQETIYKLINQIRVK